MSPYLCIKLNGKVYDVDVNFLKSAIFVKQCDDMGTLDFVIEDTMDLSLEAQIMAMIANAGQPLMSFQYGWYNGPKSPWFEAMIMDFKPTFHPPHTVTMTVNAVLDVKPPETHCKTWIGDDITKIVTQICGEEGWAIAEIDQADPLSKEREFVQGNMQSVSFIREKLIPEATSGGMEMKFMLTTTEGGGARAYFIRQDKHMSSPVREYKVYAGNEGPVISFDPSYNGIEVSAKDQDVVFIDDLNNEAYVYKADVSGVAPLQTELTVYNATSPDKMEQMGTRRWYQRNMGSYPATLTVVGDPNISPLEYVDIFAFRLDHSLHHTSGRYLITEIRDEIGPHYATTLTLIRFDSLEVGRVLEAVKEMNRVC
jgi:hypothetical protein